MSVHDETVGIFVLLSVLVLSFTAGFFSGKNYKEEATLDRWCESVHEGQMQGDFCITPENAAIPRPEWSK